MDPGESLEKLPARVRRRERGGQSVPIGDHEAQSRAAPNVLMERFGRVHVVQFRGSAACDRDRSAPIATTIRLRANALVPELLTVAGTRRSSPPRLQETSANARVHASTTSAVRRPE